MEPPQTTAAANAEHEEYEEDESYFDRLPAALLARILQALPQRKRLASCASVCTSWAAAAAAATVEVDLTAMHGTEIQAFQPWLKQHGGQVVSLSCAYHGGGWLPVCLPCGQLQQLSRLGLTTLELQLDTQNAGDSSSSSSSSVLLPRLQQLKLQYCRLSSTTLTHLAQLSGLTRLKLVGSIDPNRRIMREDMELILQGLPNLAHLSLGSIYPSSPAFPIPGLPAASLTALSLESACSFSSGADSLARLAFLQKLKLVRSELSPVALATLSRLTHLQLYDCLVEPGDELQDSEADMRDVAALLAAIGGLRQLQHLVLADDYDYLTRTGQPADYAALTASSQLTHLHILGFCGQPLPQGAAVQHMFPAGRQLPQLQQLVLECGAMRYPEGWITTADLQSIVSACPALRRLDISGVLAAGADVRPLLQLPSTCASLTLSGSAVGDSAAGVVAQLTQLTFLGWSKSPGLTDAGLQLLTALQALQTFRICDLASLSSIVVPPNSFGLPQVFQLTTGNKSVSQQLQDHLQLHLHTDAEHTGVQVTDSSGG